MGPDLRVDPRPTKRGLKLCYRCGRWLSIVSAEKNAEKSAFTVHEEECLQRAREADQRKRGA